MGHCYQIPPKATHPLPDPPQSHSPACPHTQAARRGTTLDLGHLICFLLHVCGEVGVHTWVCIAAGFSSGGSEMGQKEASQRRGKGCRYHRMLSMPREKKIN